MKNDLQLKRYLEEAVRHKMGSYSLEADADGNMDVDTEPTAESDDENLIILWGAWLFYKFAYKAIASERTRMFAISYADAYQQAQDIIAAIEEAIVALDSTQAMFFDSETAIEFYGKILTRTDAALATWDTV
jgi:hypothetical protein